MNDVIKKPSHYQGKNGLEAVDVIKNFGASPDYEEGFYWGNAIKYMLRFHRKNGVEDLKKARQNLDWLIETLEHNVELGVLKSPKWNKYVTRFKGASTILENYPDNAFRLTRSEAEKYPDYMWVSLKEVNA